MKKQLHFLLTLGFLAVTTIPASAFDYNITFTGSGASTTVSNVEVQNLTQNTSVVVPAGAPVILTVSTASPHLKANSLNLKIYPNPMTEKSIVSFYSEFGGKTDIAVYGMDGRTIIRTTKNLSAGTNQFKLSLPQGVFTLHINENGILHIGTVISQTKNKAELEFSGTEPAATKPMQKVRASATALGYNAGDQLLFKGYSGDYCTIITLKATSDTIVNFNFVECRDADGYNYPVVQIGDQTWMVENLKTTFYRNGERISNVTDNAIWAALTTGAWCDFNNDPLYGTKYGKLYNWYALNDARNIAPEGWHVPTGAEWATLENYLIANGNNYDGTTTGNKIAKALAATTDWGTFTGKGVIGNDLTINNSTGFTALPGGTRNHFGAFITIGYNGYWWSSTEDVSGYAWLRYLLFDYEDLGMASGKETCGSSVRCLMDTDDEIPTIITNSISNVTQSSATSGGDITSDGGSLVTERGVCWNTDKNPTIVDSKTSDGAGTGEFVSNLTGLSPGTTYYVRAFATNSVGTAYGNEVSFTTKDIMYEIEYNDEMIYANLLTEGLTVYFSLNTSNDIDWFKIYVPEGKYLNYNFEIPTNVSGIWRIIIYNSGMVQGNVHNMPYTTSSKYPVNKSDYYYFKISPMENKFLYNNAMIKLTVTLSHWY